MPQQPSEVHRAEEASAYCPSGNQVSPLAPVPQPTVGSREGRNSDRMKHVVDPFAHMDTGRKWKELLVGGKLWRVLWVIIRVVLVTVMLYLFICSLDVLQAAFQLLGGRTAGQVFQQSDLLNNPVCGLIIGVLVTVLVQSSSTSTSIVVTMVAAQLLSVRQSIPIIMGANIGTSVTNTLVSLTQSAEREVFRRSFAGATVHDMFNWSCVVIFLPLEAATGFLYHMTKVMVKDIVRSDATNQAFLKVITKPLTDMIISIDKSVIYAIAEGTDRRKFPLAKYYCKIVSWDFSQCFNSIEDINITFVQDIQNKQFTTTITLQNTTDPKCPVQFSWNDVLELNSTKCTHLFTGIGVPGHPLSEAAAGATLFVLALLTMILCLLLMVKLLNSLMKGPMAKVIHKVINADFPGPARHLTGYVAILLGAGLTILVQSSSVFTSALTPLVGIDIITVERMYPLTLGSNIGTTVTGILAALTADTSRIQDSLQVSFAHLFFNICGIVLFYPVPIMRKWPPFLAKRLGDITATYRWFSVLYLLCLFFLLPGIILGLSLAGVYVLIGVGVPILLLVIMVAVIKLCQSRCVHCLPARLHNWNFLPYPLRSLKPYDKVITACCANSFCKNTCKCCYAEHAEQQQVAVVTTGQPQHGCGNHVVANGNGHINAAFSAEEDLTQTRL